MDVGGLGDEPLEQEMKEYGYSIRSFWYDSKCHLFAIRNFAIPQSKPLPDMPALKLYSRNKHRRQEAQEYETRRQKMGYVTEL